MVGPLGTPTERMPQTVQRSVYAYNHTSCIASIRNTAYVICGVDYPASFQEHGIGTVIDKDKHEKIPSAAHIERSSWSVR